MSRLVNAYNTGQRRMHASPEPPSMVPGQTGIYVALCGRRIRNITTVQWTGHVVQACRDCTTEAARAR